MVKICLVNPVADIPRYMKKANSLPERASFQSIFPDRASKRGFPYFPVQAISSTDKAKTSEFRADSYIAHHAFKLASIILLRLLNESLLYYNLQSLNM